MIRDIHLYVPAMPGLGLQHCAVALGCVLILCIMLTSCIRDFCRACLQRESGVRWPLAALMRSMSADPVRLYCYARLRVRAASYIVRPVFLLALAWIPDKQYCAVKVPADISPISMRLLRCVYPNDSSCAGLVLSGFFVFEHEQATDEEDGMVLAKRAAWLTPSSLMLA